MFAPSRSPNCNSWKNWKNVSDVSGLGVGHVLVSGWPLRPSPAQQVTRPQVGGQWTSKEMQVLEVNVSKIVIRRVKFLCLKSRASMWMALRYAPLLYVSSALIWYLLGDVKLTGATKGNTSQPTKHQHSTTLQHWATRNYEISHQVRTSTVGGQRSSPYHNI